MFFKSLTFLDCSEKAALLVAKLDPFARSSSLEGLDNLVEGVAPIHGAFGFGLTQLLVDQSLALRELPLLSCPSLRALPCKSRKSRPGAPDYPLLELSVKISKGQQHLRDTAQSFAAIPYLSGSSGARALLPWKFRLQRFLHGKAKTRPGWLWIF